MLFRNLLLRTAFRRRSAVRVDSRRGAIYDHEFLDHELVLDHDILSSLQVSKSRFLPIECHRYRERHRGHEQRSRPIPQRNSCYGSWWAIERFVRKKRNLTIFRNGLDFSRDDESCRAMQ